MMKTSKMKMNVIKFLFLFSVVLYSQNVKIDSTKLIEKPMSFSTFFNPFTHLQDEYFYTQLEDLLINPSLSMDTSSIWMKTRLQLAYMNSNQTSNVKSNILDPLYNQYAASQNLKLLKQIIGAVQVGAVGYLAYMHIKKYGFLKKK